MSERFVVERRGGRWEVLDIEGEAFVRAFGDRERAEGEARKLNKHAEIAAAQQPYLTPLVPLEERGCIEPGCDRRGEVVVDGTRARCLPCHERLTLCRICGREAFEGEDGRAYHEASGIDHEARLG